MTIEASQTNNDTYLADLRSLIRSSAEDLSGVTDFKPGNLAMANLVSSISVEILTADLGIVSDQSMEKLDDVFLKLCERTGSEFEAAQGTDENSIEYKKAKSAVAGHVIALLPQALEAVGNKADIENIIPRIGLLNVVKIAAEDLHLEVPILNFDDLKADVMRTVDPEDYFIEEVEKMHKNYEILSKEEEDAVRVAIAMAQAGYVNTQMQRAKKEKGRLNRDQMDTNTGMKMTFNKIGGLARVGFEVLKDIVELQRELDKRNDK